MVLDLICSNGNSYGDEREIETLPRILRAGIAGYDGAGNRQR